MTYAQWGVWCFNQGIPGKFSKTEAEKKAAELAKENPGREYFVVSLDTMFQVPLEPIRTIFEHQKIPR